jgi:hypothetical protein
MNCPEAIWIAPKQYGLPQSNMDCLKAIWIASKQYGLPQSNKNYLYGNMHCPEAIIIAMGVIIIGGEDL